MLLWMLPSALAFVFQTSPLGVSGRLAAPLGCSPLTRLQSALSRSLVASDGSILIVGGGPSGLGAALELDTIMNSELREKWGGAKITLVDKAQPISAYDPTRGFM